MDGQAIGLISTRSKPLGNTVPDLLAFFRNQGDTNQFIVRSPGFFALELNGKFFGPFNLNGTSSPLTPGERLGPVTIEPGKLREIPKLRPGDQPAENAARPQLRRGKNTLRVIYWHDNKPVHSGKIELKNQP